jgi:uncharacterized DUF497 family protein
MLDLARIVGFDWDDGNARKNLLKHGVNQLEAEQVFLDPRLFLAEDVKHSRSEKRFQALGKTLDGDRLHVTFTLRADGTRIRVISARPMSRKEKALYEQEA